MESKALGTTQVRISEIGFGTWRYAGGIEPLLAGIEMGGCLVDKAESYGTEELVGQAIRAGWFRKTTSPRFRKLFQCLTSAKIAGPLAGVFRKQRTISSVQRSAASAGDEWNPPDDVGQSTCFNRLERRSKTPSVRSIIAVFD
jgi:hypothetical protein